MPHPRLAALLGLALASCIQPAAFPCERDDQCNATGSGVCSMPEGYCAYEDSSCDSGFRFESRAPNVGGRCVEEDEGTGTGTGSSSGTDNGTGTGTGESSGEEVCGGAFEPCCGEMCSERLVCLGAACGCGFLTLSGTGHSCHVHNSGNVECWGSNVSGSLGRPTGGELDPAPGFVGGLPTPLRVDAVDGRDHTCIISSSRNVYCWGANEAGQASFDVDDPRILEANVVVESDTFEWEPMVVATGLQHTCVGGEGRVFCWGGDNGAGQLGWLDVEATEVDTSDWRGELEALVAGGAHTCAHTIEESGEHHVYCWGWDLFGQLGNGDGDETSAVPDEVVLPADLEVTQISASDVHTCIVAGPEGAQDVLCWGSNESGQSVADGSMMATIPTPVEGLPTGAWLSLSAGPTSTCAMSESEGLWCWGDNTFGKVLPGNPEPILPPTLLPMPSPDNVALFPAVGTVHTCATALDGTILCWGCGSDGQLGPDAPPLCNNETDDFWVIVPSC